LDLFSFIALLINNRTWYILKEYIISSCIYTHAKDILVIALRESGTILHESSLPFFLSSLWQHHTFFVFSQPATLSFVALIQFGCTKKICIPHSRLPGADLHGRKLTNVYHCFRNIVSYDLSNILSAIRLSFSLSKYF
jgi:hypothetical protein